MMHSDRGNQFAPGRLWSLLDMLEVKAKAFALAVDYIAQLSVAKFQPGNQPDLEQAADAVMPAISEIRHAMEVLGLDTAIVSLDRVEEVLSSQTVRFSVLQHRIDELRGRFYDGLGNQFFLAIAPSHVSLYEGGRLFGDEVAVKFPSISDEITEAGKCLALDRPTAGAFHLIRCFEAAIRAMSRCLGIPDPIKGTDRNWGNVLRTISAEIEQRWPKATRLRGDALLFESFHAVLTAMQNPYRNSTMHLEIKYTDAEARHLFEIVKGFMQKVASRMDESGLPLA
ncbi:hypothetical protein [Chelativorans xinjiangense]|uniref:hypothetical protein n=1 Tax=Chelativorans xinjiangense TaxID=2681485 RepID=UPI001357D445|nr:hypothetical protein [Chelativorans xinjiangense]